MRAAHSAWPTMSCWAPAAVTYRICAVSGTASWLAACIDALHAAGLLRLGGRLMCPVAPCRHQSTVMHVPSHMVIALKCRGYAGCMLLGCSDLGMGWQVPQSAACTSKLLLTHTQCTSMHLPSHLGDSCKSRGWQKIMQCHNLPGCSAYCWATQSQGQMPCGTLQAHVHRHAGSDSDCHDFQL